MILASEEGGKLNCKTKTKTKTKTKLVDILDLKRSFEFRQYKGLRWFPLVTGKQKQKTIVVFPDRS